MKTIVQMGSPMNMLDEMTWLIFSSTSDGDENCEDKESERSHPTADLTSTQHLL
jgi:hypothetical protein